jgi:hypothetical protein
MTEKINNEDRITITRWIDTRLEAMERIHQAEREADQVALRLQAAEYERRLDALNNENARVQAAISANVSQDRFFSLEKDTRTLERIIPTLVTSDMHTTLINTLQQKTELTADEFQRRVGAIEKWQTSIDGKLIGAFGVITLISIIIGIVSHFWK